MPINMLRSLILILFLFCTFPGLTIYGQSLTDSLRAELRNAEGKQRINLLNELANRLSTIDPTESDSLNRLTFSVLEHFDYPKGYVKALLVRATYLNQRNQLYQADSVLKIALPLAKEINDLDGQGWGELTMATLNYRRGNYAEAIQSHFNGIEAAQALGDADLETTHLINVGLIHQLIGKLDQTEHYLKQAVDLAQANALKFRLAQAYGNLGVLEFSRRNLGLSLEYNQKALGLFQDLGDNSMASVSFNNLGFALASEKRFDEALAYYDQAIELKILTEDAVGHSSVLLNKAKVYNETGNYSLALKLANESLDLALSWKSKRLQRDAYQLISTILEITNRNKESLAYYKKFAQMKDSTDLDANANKIQRLTREFEFDKLKKENDLQKSLNEVQSLELKQRGLLIMSLLLVLLVFVVFFLVYRMRLRTKLLLSEKDHQLMTIESQLKDEALQAEREKLSLYAKNMLGDQTETTEPLDETDTKDLIQGLADMVNQSITDNRDWVAFNLYFEATYPNFFRLLADKNGELTLNEQRLAALMKIKLSNKEMATILNISNDSVVRAKYRLRDRLSFSKLKELQVFIEEI